MGDLGRGRLRSARPRGWDVHVRRHIQPSDVEARPSVVEFQGSRPQRPGLGGGILSLRPLSDAGVRRVVKQSRLQFRARDGEVPSPSGNGLPSTRAWIICELGPSVSGLAGCHSDGPVGDRKAPQSGRSCPVWPQKASSQSSCVLGVLGRRDPGSGKEPRNAHRGPVPVCSLPEVKAPRRRTGAKFSLPWANGSGP